ncbi:MAG: DUF6263 family protein [Flavisolibacter sp.]
MKRVHIWLEEEIVKSFCENNLNKIYKPLQIYLADIIVIMKIQHLLPVLFTLIFLSCKNEDKKSDTAETSKDSSITTNVIQNDSFSGVDKADSPPQLTPSNESVQLKFNMPKGKTYDFNMVFDMKQEVNAQIMNNHMRFNYDMQVVDEKEKVKTIKTTYKRIDMAMAMGENKMDFSSEKGTSASFDPLQIVSKMLSVIKGKSFTMKVNDKGEISDVDGFEEIGQTMVKEMNLPEASKAQMLAQFKSQFNDDAVKEMFSTAFNIYPDKPVKVGDTWQKTIKGRDAKPVVTTYTVQEIKDGKVKLFAKSTSPIDQRTTMIVNAKTGLVMDASINQKMAGEKKMTGTGRITSREL